MGSVWLHLLQSSQQETRTDPFYLTKPTWTNEKTSFVTFWTTFVVFSSCRTRCSVQSHTYTGHDWITHLHSTTALILPVSLFSHAHFAIVVFKKKNRPSLMCCHQHAEQPPAWNMCDHCSELQPNSLPASLRLDEGLPADSLDTTNSLAINQSKLLRSHFYISECLTEK